MPPNPFRMRRPLGVPGSANQATDASPAPSVHTAREDNTPSRSGSVNLGARASSIRPRGISHGSVEQHPTDVFGRTTQSPQRPQTPRRARSPEADARSHSRDRDRRRQERRGLFQDSPPAGEPPQGFGSRLLTVESNIKDCVREIQSLKSTIGEISGHFETIQKAKFELDAKLDKTFGDWNERIAASEKNSTTLLDVASSNMANAFDRIQKLEFEVLKLVGRAPDDHQPSNAPTSNNFGSPLSGGTQWASAGPNVAGSTFGQSGAGPSPTGPPSSFGPNVNAGTTPGNSSSAFGGPTFGASSTPTWSAPPSAPAPPSSWGPPPQPMPTPAPGPATPPMSQNASTWAAAGAGTNMMPWNDKHWTADPKVPKELRTFDGDIRHYDKWRLRVRYHFISTNIFYQNIFDLIEQNRVPITFQNLSNTSIALLPNANWIWLANHIWGFIGKVVNDTMLGRMATLAGGEEFNGFELWRALHVEYRGGSTEMSCNERGFFIDFPQCVKDDDLQNHIVQ